MWSRKSTSKFKHTLTPCSRAIREFEFEALSETFQLKIIKLAATN